MGFYLLNISVDTVDPKPEYIPEDLSINDQESILEIIVEKVLGYENAIKEYDDHDSEDHNKKKETKTDLLIHFPKTYNLFNHLNKRKILYPNQENQLLNAFKEIDSPPPKF
ncbi:hypothetical protein C9994_06660 [Marivirga lumbricoides]|uniref:Uncharacterized protein n=1 Tax=Marivirga lumbricoides TaxID=1046115 RepID=A0A2T4DRW9_9BACT|nr:hypothetical protein C9994_06660 [Marivirga lumbricoides]